jgi:CarD family transcriptional regulator
MFEVGDKVVYPHHGAGTVLAREFHEIRGERREYLTIEILQPQMTVMVPCENAETAGLRPVINERAVNEVLAVLVADGSEMPAQWNQRFKRNQEKLRSGDILELAEVVRNLERRAQDARLSPGEMQMLERARRVLVSELMYARNVEEDAANQLIDDALAGKLKIKHKPSAKRVAPKPPPKADPKAAAAARAAAAQQSRSSMRATVRPPLSSTPQSVQAMARAAMEKAAEAKGTGDDTPAKKPAAKKASTTAKKTTSAAAKKPAAKKASTTAKKTTSAAAKKPAAKKASTTAKKTTSAAAKKPAAKKASTTAARKPAAKKK